MEPLLRLPGDLLGLLANRQALLPSCQQADYVRSVLIRPCRLPDDPSEVTIAGFRDASALHPITAAVLARHHTAVAHQFPGVWEARQGTEFGNDGCRRGLRDPTQGLQSFDHGPDLRRRMADGFVNRLLQLHNPIPHVVHFFQIMSSTA
ncbi:MAG: hypothetical protein NTW28_35580 [Candidatus Solibacter sp.]|nr:hypothetical protein [Candidatus Solibacter sp.]